MPADVVGVQPVVGYWKLSSSWSSDVVKKKVSKGKHIVGSIKYGRIHDVSLE